MFRFFCSSMRKLPQSVMIANASNRAVLNLVAANATGEASSGSAKVTRLFLQRPFFADNFSNPLIERSDNSAPLNTHPAKLTEAEKSWLDMIEYGNPPRTP